MQRLWWVFCLLCAQVVGCASSVPVECPEGFELSGADCEPEPTDRMEDPPDAGTTPDAGSTPDASICDDTPCDDDNECTDDGCDEDGCTNELADDGTVCVFEDGAGVCESGTCVRDCEVEDCREVYPCTEQGLRDAIDAGGETVIGCNGPTTVALQDGELLMTKDVSIDGLGLLTVDAEGRSRVFNASETAHVELVGIDITGGNAATESEGNGGGVHGSGDTVITLRGCTVLGNTALIYGGGIRTSGQLFLEDTTVTNNSADRHGGGIALWQGAVISNSVVSDNVTVGRGGGVYIVLSPTYGSTPVTVRDSTLARNQAGATGGAIWTKDTLTIEGTTFEDNSAIEGGGAIRNVEASVTIRESHFEGNNASAGGAIANYRGIETIISGTRFVENWTVDSSGGAIFTDATTLDVVNGSFEGNRASTGAGAVYSKNSACTFTSSTFTGNEANVGGAFRFYGNTVDRIDALFRNCTISGNRANDIGGASADRSATVQMHHTTVTGNTAANQGAGIHQIQNSVLEASYSVIDAGCYSEPDSLLVSLGYNAVLSTATEQCVLTPVDGVNTDLILSPEEMKLEALADNGGSTLTHLPSIDSVLIDAVSAANCSPEINEDQRGKPRNNGASCDIGAVELQDDD